MCHRPRSGDAVAEGVVGAGRAASIRGEAAPAVPGVLLRRGRTPFDRVTPSTTMASHAQPDHAGLCPQHQRVRHQPCLLAPRRYPGEGVSSWVRRLAARYDILGIHLVRYLR